MLRLATEAEHERTREHCLALYMVGTKQSNATRWALTIGHQGLTAHRWIYACNAKGMEGIMCKHTGGRRRRRRGNRQDSERERAGRTWFAR